MYSFHHHRRCWPIFIRYLPTMYLVVLVSCRPTHQIPVQCWASVAGRMTINRLRRWPNTNPLLGLLYILRKHVAFTQCCFNVDPVPDAGPTLGDCTVLTDCCIVNASDAFHSCARIIRKQNTLAQCWINAGPMSAPLGQHYSTRTLYALITIFNRECIFSKHFLKMKVLNLGISNVIFDMFIRTGVQKCQPFPRHNTPLSPK